MLTNGFIKETSMTDAKTTIHERMNLQTSLVLIDDYCSDGEKRQGGDDYFEGLLQTQFQMKGVNQI